MEFTPISIRERINWDDRNVRNAECFAMKAVIIRSLVRFGWSVDKIKKVDFMLRLVDDSAMSYFKEDSEVECLNFLAFDKGFCIHVFTYGDNEYASAQLRIINDFRMIDTPSELYRLVYHTEADETTHSIDEALAELDKMHKIDMVDVISIKDSIQEYDMLKDGNIPQTR